MSSNFRSWHLKNKIFFLKQNTKSLFLEKLYVWKHSMEYSLTNLYCSHFQVYFHLFPLLCLLRNMGAMLASYYSLSLSTWWTSKIMFKIKDIACWDKTDPDDSQASNYWVIWLQLAPAFFGSELSWKKYDECTTRVLQTPNKLAFTIFAKILG